MDITRRGFLKAVGAAGAMGFLSACSGSGAGGGGSDSGAAPGTLVVGYSNFSSKFSPFFAETAYDVDACGLTQLPIYVFDRLGQDVYNGIEGETREYNGTDYTYYGPADITITENSDGTVWYDFKLREDLVHSDGEPVTIDDAIFSMYVMSDPTFDGSAVLYSMPIEGMEAYRSGMTPLMNLLIAAGEDNTDFSLWDEETQNAFWPEYKDAFVNCILDYLVGNGYNAPEDGIDVMMANWGYEVPADATTVYVFDTMAAGYGSVAEMVEAESAGALDAYMENYATYSVGIETGESAPNITGIQKIDDYTMRVVATKVDATLIGNLQIYLSPLHYYGDKELFDPENNSFGFPKGDLTLPRAKTTQPMGPGPYKFIKFENGVISFEANDTYYLSAPKTQFINFREMTDDDKLNGVVTGTVDITDPSWSKETQKAVEKANGNDDINGDVITTSLVDNNGYGYLAMNALNVSVNNEPGSDASKSLRKALGTIFSVYRDVSVDSYYGEAASTINYPLSNTSWAAPQPTDDDYHVAFSVDVDGNDIYTSDMEPEDKYAPAKAAALGWFAKAGYTVEGEKVTAAPEGGKLEFEAMIPADGSGNHPAFMMLTEAKQAFDEMGINLIINDLTDSSELWDKLNAHQGEIWCAAWSSTRDPDLYQVYYSDVANGGAAAGGSNYMYDIADPELDELILAARASTDQAYRKQVIKAALDIIADWAVELPTYQRKNAIIFSSERVNLDTVTPDITTFYPWMSEIENIELA